MFDPRAALDAILPHLDRSRTPAAKWPDGKGEYWPLCPFHPDQHIGSFSVSEHGFKCFSCQAKGGLGELAGRLGLDVPKLGSKAVVREGITDVNISLAGYARAKHLPEDFLENTFSVSERKRGDRTSLRMPYLDEAGQEVCVRYRIAMTGDKFRVKSGNKLSLYGLWLLDKAATDVLLVEGESDTQTLVYHGIPALGVPGAQNWQPAWVQHVAGRTVYAWQEPDEAGKQFIARIGADVPDLRVVAAPAGTKDISAAHSAGEDVPALIARLKAGSQPYAKIQAETLDQTAREAERVAGDLLRAPSILAEFGALCERLGLIGEEHNAKLLYLALVSRFLEGPVNVVMKGPSSGGKSFTVKTVLRCFPPSAYYALSSMSERALAYINEPLVHRFLVIYEAAGMGGEVGDYLLRSLLSEGVVRYLTVEKTVDGLNSKIMERPGPTGLLTTTTLPALHPENETRLLSLTVRDDRAQTARILRALARRVNGSQPVEVDLAPWHALQIWLTLAGQHDVVIPYADDLAVLSDPRAVRIRRDFGAVLSLVLAHAILHQATRACDEHGCIVATIADYAAVYDLVIDALSQGVKASVSATIRETVTAVAEIERETRLPVSLQALAERLNIDVSAARRRAKVAAEDEYLVDLAAEKSDQHGKQKHRGKASRLTIGEPLPAETSVLPTPTDLEDKLIHYIPPCTTALLPNFEQTGMQQVNREREVFTL